MIGWRTKTAGGVTQLAQLRIKFTVEEPEPVFVRPTDDDMIDEDEAAITA